jgi:hypothetical protein
MTEGGCHSMTAFQMMGELAEHPRWGAVPHWQLRGAKETGGRRKQNYTAK